MHCAGVIWLSAVFRHELGAWLQIGMQLPPVVAAKVKQSLIGSRVIRMKPLLFSPPPLQRCVAQPIELHQLQHLSCRRRHRLGGLQLVTGTDCP